MRRLLLAAVLAAAAHLGLLDAHAVWSIQTVNTGTQVGLATLTAPAGTAATNSGSGRIKVSWTPPPAANQGTQTNLLRHNASNPQPDATLVAVGGATASYLDTGLAAVVRDSRIKFAAEANRQLIDDPTAKAETHRA